MPIVFAYVADPLGDGFVDNADHRRPDACE
jgi:hypothetical protein